MELYIYSGPLHSIKFGRIQYLRKGSYAQHNRSSTNMIILFLLVCHRPVVIISNATPLIPYTADLRVSILIPSSLAWREGGMLAYEGRDRWKCKG